MDAFIMMVSTNRNALAKMLDAMNKEIETLPEGRLGTKKSRGYGYLKWNKKSGERHLSMKKDEDVEIAQALRRKLYLEKLTKEIEKNIEVIDKLLRDYKPFKPHEVKASLSKAYQIPPGKEKEILPGFELRKASEYVFKSKSEEIAALVIEGNNLEMMYEWGIRLYGKVYRPDFTIRVPGTNELIYYEHFGMPDHPGYYGKMLEKLMDYWHAGIRIGENLIVTFETKEHPLTAADVQNALDSFFTKYGIKL